MYTARLRPTTSSSRTNFDGPGVYAHTKRVQVVLNVPGQSARRRDRLPGDASRLGGHPRAPHLAASLPARDAATAARRPPRGRHRRLARRPHPDLEPATGGFWHDRAPRAEHRLRGRARPRTTASGCGRSASASGTASDRRQPTAPELLTQTRRKEDPWPDTPEPSRRHRPEEVWHYLADLRSVAEWDPSVDARASWRGEPDEVGALRPRGQLPRPHASPSPTGRSRSSRPTGWSSRPRPIGCRSATRPASSQGASPASSPSPGTPTCGRGEFVGYSTPAPRRLRPRRRDARRGACASGSASRSSRTDGGRCADEGAGAQAGRGRRRRRLRARRRAELARAGHDVPVFEAAPYAGGHSNTVDVETDGRPDARSTPASSSSTSATTRTSSACSPSSESTPAGDMSFSVSDGQGGFEWSTRGPRGAVRPAPNVLDPRFHRMLRDLVRFNREARGLIGTPRRRARRCARFLAEGGYSRVLRRAAARPAGLRGLVRRPGAVARASRPLSRRVPRQPRRRFSSSAGPRWRTIPGGSRRYVEALTEPFRDRVRLRHAGARRSAASTTGSRSPRAAGPSASTRS